MSAYNLQPGAERDFYRMVNPEPLKQCPECNADILFTPHFPCELKEGFCSACGWCSYCGGLIVEEDVIEENKRREVARRKARYR